LIHRDIKPANILLENGVERVKITDFGLARTTSDGGITHTGEIPGTPQCMSPEQARGEIVDQRSDLFSLGCVMYTMCTDVSPFRASNMSRLTKNGRHSNR
jgi:serine/threonine protein kinase